MRILGFGTYDGSKQPRIAVLLSGLREMGADVDELNVPLGFTTAQRVEMLHKPWLGYRLLARMVLRWSVLTLRRTSLSRSPDVIVVGYLGQFDVLLARLLFPRAMIVLDLLVFADDTAMDRGVSAGLRTWLLRWVDRAAIGAATLVVVDTEENLMLLSPHQRAKALVVAVGAAAPWFIEPTPRDGPLRVVFFGMYTPLQGAPVIGAALAELASEVSLEVTMIGTGQDYEETRNRVGQDRRVTWVPWVQPKQLPALVAGSDVCLGIFGTSTKARRVVPTKVYQGAAAGCAILTSDTAPQRRALGDAARYVAPGDAQALAEALARLASHPEEVARLRGKAFDVARRSFEPVTVVAPLFEALRSRTRQEIR